MGRDFKIEATLSAKDTATPEVKKVSGAFGKLGELIGPGGLFVAGAAATVAAFDKIGDAIGGAVEAANIQEEAVNKVTTALGLVGEATPEAVKGFEDFAASLQKSTTAGDETILQMSALALSFTDSAEEAKKLTSAALDFSKGAGIGFEEALRRLGRSLGGATGDIANFAPEIRNLTADAIKNGAAIDLIAEKYAGFAAAEAQTFGGAMQQLSNNFGDLQEIVGSAITENDFFAEKIRELNELLGSAEFQQTLKDVVDAIAGFTQGTIEAIAAIKDFLAPVGDLLSALNTLTGGLFDVSTAIDFYIQKGKAAGQTNKELKEETAGLTEKSLEFLEANKKQAAAAGDTATALDAQSKQTEQTKQSSDALTDSTEKTKDAIESLSKDAVEGLVTNLEALNKAFEGTTEEQKDFLSSVFGDTLEEENEFLERRIELLTTLLDVTRNVRQEQDLLNRSLQQESNVSTTTVNGTSPGNSVGFGSTPSDSTDFGQRRSQIIGEDIRAGANVTRTSRGTFTGA